MSSKMILINTAFLNYPDDLKEELIQGVKGVMLDKYQGTGVIITDDVDAATSFTLADDQNQLRVVAIHNNPIAEGLTPDALGVAIHGSDVAFVPADEFHATEINSLAEQIGTVASHEAGHLFLPPGHSIEPTNLMNNGEHLTEYLDDNNGRNLHFTELQKAIIRGEIPIDDHIRLDQIEESGTMVSNADHDHQSDDNYHDHNADHSDLIDNDLNHYDVDPDIDIDIDVDPV